VVVLVEGDVTDDYIPEIRGIGTGFFVDKEHVLTVAHVANHLIDDTIRLVLWNGQKIAARKIATDELNDLALLRVDFNDVKFYKIPRLNLGTDPQIGELVFLIGSPYLFRGTMSVGILSRRTTIVPNSLWNCDVYLVDAVCEGGHSGSPAFDAKLGVVGILTGYCGKFSVLIPSYSVCCFLRVNGIK
jgi:S1-C subfamily serine protease